MWAKPDDASGTGEATRRAFIPLAPSAMQVVVVEDDPDQANLVRTMLTLEQPRTFSIVHVAQLAEAVSYLQREEADILLLDLGLPDTSGLDGLDRLRQLVPGTPIVVLTALADEAAAAAALHKGAQDYLVKGTFDSAVLARTIRYAIERNRVVRQLDSITTQLRAANTRLEQIALLDPLTQVLNRRGLQQVLSREIAWARRNRTEILALLLDLDDFKHINDTLGHAVGDVVLQELAKKLQASLRTTDYLARIGGDEFVILLPQTRLAEGMQIAEKVRLLVAETPVMLGSGAAAVTASIGVVSVAEAITSLGELLSRMHLVLAESKQAGKNRVNYRLRGEERPKEGYDVLSGVLQMLVRGDSFRVVKEPIFRLADEQVIGYEFLSRLPEGAFEIPENFFRLSLEANILTLVDQWCFKACVAAGLSVPAGARQHLNLFPSTILDIPVPDLLEVLPPQRLPGSYCIEISEQQIVGDPQNLAKPVHELKRAGILIAFDDVGFGRSCLESLTVLEPDIIKIDKRCVTGVGDDVARLRPLKRLLKLAEALGTEAVAEGIESRQDLEVLKSFGVKYGQGFLWKEVN